MLMFFKPLAMMAILFFKMSVKFFTGKTFAFQDFLLANHKVSEANTWSGHWLGAVGV